MFVVFPPLVVDDRRRERRIRRLARGATSSATPSDLGEFEHCRNDEPKAAEEDLHRARLNLCHQWTTDGYKSSNHHQVNEGSTPSESMPNSQGSKRDDQEKGERGHRGIMHMTCQAVETYPT
jgi:hypothetical protein